MAWKRKEGWDSNLGDCLEVGCWCEHTPPPNYVSQVLYTMHTTLHMPHTTLSDMHSQTHVVW